MSIKNNIPIAFMAETVYDLLINDMAGPEKKFSYNSCFFKILIIKFRITI
ncbi:hypothetical protein GCM10022209_58500 [Chitinophaga oryziterrae]